MSAPRTTVGFLNRRTVALDQNPCDAQVELHGRFTIAHRKAKGLVTELEAWEPQAAAYAALAVLETLLPAVPSEVLAPDFVARLSVLADQVAYKDSVKALGSGK